MATTGPKESVLAGSRDTGPMSGFTHPIARGREFEAAMQRMRHTYQRHIESSAWRDVLLSLHPNLRAASENLDEVRERANEYAIPTPLPGHVERVKEILYGLHQHVPRFYMAYLMLDGQIAIDIRNEASMSGILIKIAADGSVTCIYDTQDNQETEFYEPADQFPDQAALDAIGKLDQEVGS